MFRIGEFSKLSQVPVKTLRYYDEIGLIRPASVDPATGYRYYTAEQLPRLNTVLALKDLGFKLEQIHEFVDDHLTAEQMEGMLRLRRAEIRANLQDEEARLARVEHRLRLITQEAPMPKHEVVIKKAEPIRVAAARGVVANYQSVGPLFGEVMSELGRHQIVPAGPAMALYYDEEYKEADVDVEAAVPIAAGEIPPAGRVRVRELEAFDAVASLTRRGPYDDFTPAYQALMAWIQSNGYRIIGPNREIYLTGPESGSPPEAYVTEIQFPVAKA
jgi:effector-binding domain-containing protein